MSAAPGALIDLGNRQVKYLLATATAPQTWDWHDQAARQALAAALEASLPPTAEVVVASSSPQGWTTLQALLAGRRCHLLQAEELPLARRTEGTGIDRLLAAFAAWRLSGAQSALVASFGTAFTLDLVSADGCFQGGAIGPGLGLQQAALAQACPHLPPARAREDNPPRDSASAVAAGTELALALAIDALASRFTRELTEVPARFLHGGDGLRLAPYLPAWQHCPHLSLSGMRLLFGQEPLV